MSCFKGKEGGAEFMEKVLKGTQAGKKMVNVQNLKYNHYQTLRI